MKSDKLDYVQSIRKAVLACICTVAIYGCSGTSGSGSGEIGTGGESTAVTANVNSGALNDVSNTTNMNGVSALANADEESESTESDAPPVIAQPSTVETEPSSPATIRVDFDINVPNYISDELQVRLTWGDINTTAAWVQDENWAVTEMFPAGTENPLVVTFADRNGAITLGSFESTFRTGTGPSEKFQVNAYQFNTDRWDNDNDGVSNLDELIAGRNPEGDDVPVPVQVAIEPVPDKTLRITWQTTPNASHYRVFENPDGVSGFSEISGQLDASTVSFDLRIALYSRVNAQYFVQSCNDQGCADSNVESVTGTLDGAIGYIKASNTGEKDRFGTAVSLSADGTTLAVGAPGETIGSGPNVGAVYVFVRSGEFWQQQAYLEDGNTSPDSFGAALSLSADGNTLAVGESSDSNSAIGVNSERSEILAFSSGAAYVFVRSGERWQQQAYLKASNTDEFDRFGMTIDISADGNTLAVAAGGEDSLATGIDGDQSDNSADVVGAVYVFSRSDGQWQQQAYVKAGSTRAYDFFGSALSLSADGSTLAVGAADENSAATGINGEQSDNFVGGSGAAYVFIRSDGRWQQEAYIKADITGSDSFGGALSLSADGNTLAVGAEREESAATGVDADQSDNSADNSGAVYVFMRSEGLWQQQAYVKASNTDNGDAFGNAVSLSADGNTLAVGASGEDSLAIGIDADQSDNSAESSGAVYVFKRSEGLWQQQVYVKAGNTDNGDFFGGAVSLSADGNTLAVGASHENSSATEINGDQNDNSADDAGAVYLY